jgi:type VI secretion system protein ImpH
MLARLSLNRPPAPRPVAVPPPPPAPPTPAWDRSVKDRLFREAFYFDFFQAVRLLEKLFPDRIPVGRGGPQHREVVRFRPLQSLNFPPSTLYDLVPNPAAPNLPPTLVVAFFGLTGPSGVLPRHYTELLMRLEREGKSAEKFALRDWLDLFNHRFLSLFFRAWEKYRFYIPYERGEYAYPDAYTRCLYSFIGLGEATLRDRLRISLREEDEESRAREKVLAKIEDLSLLHFCGILAHRPRNVVGLEALLANFFAVDVQVEQFHGQWLRLEEDSKSYSGSAGKNNLLGHNVVAGERVWDIQGKIRVRLGPLSYQQFIDFLPNRHKIAEGKTFFLLTHLVRLYCGPQMDFDVQLVLKREEVPQCQLNSSVLVGPRLGWNTWSHSYPMTRDPADTVFDGEELVWLNQPPQAGTAAT